MWRRLERQEGGCEAGFLVSSLALIDDELIYSPCARNVLSIEAVSSNALAGIGPS